MSIIGYGWDEVLGKVINTPFFPQLMQRVDYEYNTYTIYPPRDQIFSAFQHTPFDKVRVVILGQDPYINEGQAHGMAFSVNPRVNIPPSLLNIYKELHDELGCFIPNNGYLVPWADQGVLLLNSILTVRQGQSASHLNIGWEILTDHVICQLSKEKNNIIFMLWGKKAHWKEQFIDHDKHLVLKAAHPSPLAGGAFFGCNHFIKCQEFMYEVYSDVIDWQIPNLEVK